MLASTWEAFRTPWSMSSGGPGSGLFKSTDAGDTWTEITKNPGLPAGLWGKVGVTISPVDGNRAWALIENDAEGGLYMTDDAGATWTKVSDDRNIRQRAFYYTRLVADTQEKDTVYLLNVQFYRSTDAGKTLTRIRVPHGDNHDLWISTTDNTRMIQSNDGSANVTVNRGQTWTGQDVPTGQFYNVFTTKHVPYHICGAQQDNSTACVGSQSQGGAGEGSLPPIFYAVGGGESGYIAPDPSDLNVFYAGSYGGYLTRLDRETGQQRAVNIYPNNPMGYSAIDIQERFQWTFPIVFCADRPDGALRLVAAPVAHDHRRPELGEDQSEPHALGSQDDAGLGRADYERPDRCRNLRRHLHRGAVPPGRQHHLDGLGRRLGARDARRRQDVAEGDAARPAGVRAHQPHRGLAAPERRGVPGCQPLPAGRPPAVSLQDGGLRPDLDDDHDRHPRERLPAGRARGSHAPRPALSPAPSTASTSRSTTAPPGSRCG